MFKLSRRLDYAILAVAHLASRCPSAAGTSAATVSARALADVSRIPPFSIASCATAVLIDPASGNRIAGADPRRDCYAMAY